MKKPMFSLSAKVAFLKIPPDAWDAIIPHGPKISQAIVEYMTGGVVRDIAHRVKDGTVQDRLMGLGRDMVTSAARGLIQGWEDGDDICPPWPPFPPVPWPSGHGPSGPEPDPWKIGVAEQIALADMLMSLASVTSNVAFSKQLKELSFAVVKGASRHLVEDFEKSSVHPRGHGTS